MTWLDVPADHPFGLATLPYGSVVSRSRPGPPRVAVPIGDQVLDLTGLTLDLAPGRADLLVGGTLDALLAADPQVWRTVRHDLREWLADTTVRETVERHLRPSTDVVPQLPFTVADYVDFYASEHHAARLGKLFRPEQDPLPPAWRHLPIGYHGRAGTVVVSGTPVRRPRGQRQETDGEISFGPTRRLDLEAELGIVIGRPSRLGDPVSLAEAESHIFGVCLVNDWSARDLQSWESRPLGPFLGKSFATSISPWLVPLEALSAARVPPPDRGAPLLPYLDDAGAPLGGLDITLTVQLNGEIITRPPFRYMYWTPAQLVTHLTVNGAALRSGDLLASGTVSGPWEGEVGSLIELTNGGQKPIVLADGSERTFLADGDEIVISASAPGPGETRIGLGEVVGRVSAAD